jgi:hypothetical protein
MKREQIGNQADAILNREKSKPKSSVIVIYGIHTLKDQDLAGQTPQQVREMLEDTLNIDPEAECFVNGQEIDEEEYLLQDGDRLEYSRTSGSKGVR